MTAFKTTTTNPGTGGANLATDLFTDADAQQRTMPYSALAVGEIGGPYNPVDASHPLPVSVENASLAVEGVTSGIPVNVAATALPLPTGAAADGTDGTGIAQPAGGAGIRGWLSGIYKSLAGLLTVKLYDAAGANAAAVSAAGALKIDGSAVTQPISGTVLVSNSGFAAAQSGVWTVTANQGGSNWSTNAAQIGGTAISTAEGASDAGTTRVSLGTDAGMLTFSKLSTADANQNTIKSSAGTLFRLEAFNTGAAVAYLRIYDKASNPNPATDTPKRRYTIPASTTGAGFVVEYLKGRPFANGIAYDITGGVSDTDATAIAAGQVVLNADYK